MVLTVRCGVLVALLLAGCNESLFGVHHVVPGDAAVPLDVPPDVDVPGVCSAPCVADAAAEFDGTPGGMGGHWRYLDDTRSPQRTWTVMAVNGGEMMGAGTNRITTCALHRDAAACAALPGALLVSSTGVTSGADPAIELTSPTGQVIQLTLHAYLPAGANQTIRLYRNSREDVLFTGLATAGTPLDHAVTLDALPGDRFLVAVAPTGDGAADVGLQLFASTVGKAFPSTCQLALRFDTAPIADSTSDLTCVVKRVFTHLDDKGLRAMLTLSGPPFAELVSALSNPGGTYLHSLDPMGPLDYSGDVTVQLWANLKTFVNAGAASVFSDLDATGGLAISVLPAGTISVTTPSTTTSLVEAAGPYPDPSAWHFIRVVRTAGNLRVCVDGSLAGTMDASLVRLPASLPPNFGKDLPDHRDAIARRPARRRARDHRRAAV